MSTTTVLKKGAPSRSYPSRQRKLGPAPFASFEDLSDELESPAGDCGAAAGGSSSSSGVVEMLPGIQEDHDDHHDDEEKHSSHRPVTATSSGSTVTFAVSQPTSGLQTPSTPRIDISCASSSTPPSEESEEGSEKALFEGGLGYAFHEEGTEELRSSTEELVLDENLELDSEEEKRKKKREKECYSDDIYRRASTPANIFYRRKSSHGAHTGNDYDDEHDFHRKPSAHTLFLDGLLSRPTARHASFGSSEYGRPGALSSMSARSSGSARGRSRSPSPHKMMLETSFCGSKPIPTKSMEIDESSSHSSPPPPTTTTTANEPLPQSPDIPIKVEKSESIPISPKTLPKKASTSSTTAKIVAVTRKKIPPEPLPPQIPPEEKNQRSLSIKSLTAPGRSPEPPSSPNSAGGGGDSRRPSYGRRSVSPFKMVYETSFCGSKPIPTKSMEVPDSPPKDQESEDLSAFLLSHATTTAQVHTTSRPLSPSSPKSSDHWRPITPTAVKHNEVGDGDDLSPLPPGYGASRGGGGGDKSGVSEESSPSISTSTAKYVSTPNPAQNLKLQTSNIFKWPESTASDKKSSDEITTELRFSEPPGSFPLDDHFADSDSIPPPPLPSSLIEEAKFLQSEDADADVDADDEEEDGDLPYVPTTLPVEKPSQGLVFPSKDQRRSSEGLTPLQRPKVVRPPNPASINDYIAYASGGGAGGSSGGSSSSGVDKMRINLPREDSLGASSGGGGYSPIPSSTTSGSSGNKEVKNSPIKKKGSIGATNWQDFAEMGLRSPRELRKKLREENGEDD